MKLLSRGGADLRYYAACMLPCSAFVAGAHAHALLVGPVLLLIFLLITRTSASSATWMTVDTQEIVAHFILRPSERIPLSAIAAVDARLSPLRHLPFRETVSFVSIFRKDVPGIVEIRARTSEVEAFLFTLARQAKVLGVDRLEAFVVPRRQYVRELLPLVPALGIVFLFPFAIGWASLGIALGVFVLASATTWIRFGRLAKSVAEGKVPATMKVWLDLLRTA